MTTEREAMTQIRNEMRDYGDGSPMINDWADAIDALLSRTAESVYQIQNYDHEYEFWFWLDVSEPEYRHANPEHRRILYTHPPEPARDAKAARIAELDAANVGLADESVRLQEALRFYANGEHLQGFEEWDSASGEASNWLCDPAHSPATVEDGWVAREALAPIDEPINAAMAQESGE